MSKRSTHTAGVFDIRMFIGLLLGLYGLILTAMGLLADPGLDKTGGINANLWTGLALLAFAIAFTVWSRLDPVILAEDPEAGVTRVDDAPHGAGADRTEAARQAPASAERVDPHDGTPRRS